ncbi:hypothetical protein D5266_02365, partial [bacterium c-19]|nr:hypothetical protein [bacterium c-19]
MWKKLILAVIVLSGMFSISIVANIYNQNMRAAAFFQLQKGQKVIIGNYQGNDVVWDIGNASGNDYVLMSSKPIVDLQPIYDTSINCTIYHDNVGTKWYSPSCDDTLLQNEIDNILFNNVENMILSRPAFLPSMNEVRNGGTLGLTAADRAFQTSCGYWLAGKIKNSVHVPSYPHAVYNTMQSPLDGVDISGDIDINTNTAISPNEKIRSIMAVMWSDRASPIMALSLRPFMTVSKEKINFAADATYQDGGWHNYQIDTSNLNKNNQFKPVKLRISSSLTANLDEIRRIRIGKPITKVMKDKSVELKVKSNSGSGNVISALLYDSSGSSIKYYRKLSSPSDGFVTMDLKGIPVGNYQVAIINEEYDGTNRPANSSPISNMLPLSIVEKHKITYKATPQSGATLGDYEYSKNVDAGEIVGKVTANPLGVTPLVYNLIGDGDNSYLNFEIDGLDSNKASGNTPLDVKIKNNAPDLKNGGLKAGTYKFCIIAKDDNNDPDPVDNDTKVCTSFEVVKTEPTITFDQDDKGT